jgi:hypothetical protein
VADGKVLKRPPRVTAEPVLGESVERGTMELALGDEVMLPVDSTGESVDVFFHFVLLLSTFPVVPYTKQRSFPLAT